MKKITLLALALILSLILGALSGCTQPSADPQESDSEQGNDQATTQGNPAPLVTIEQNADGATIKTASDLTYTAEGFDAVQNHALCFVKGLVLSFGDGFADEFNRFTVKYFSTAPLKITVTYTQKEERVNDVFYLEAGEKEFFAVTMKFLNKLNSSAIESIRVDTCENKSAEFILYDLSTEIISVPQAQQFIKGSRYTLGIDLKWGGAINSVEDTQCPIEKVTNLCNKHDEGRLIQQSYYGVFYRADEYVEGGYLGIEGVAYNPVQGGDVRGRESRIIDVVIEKDFIYIKAQPLDWPLENSPTPSYMENKYVVKDDYIQVYNRFVDFSGWTHPALDQELPAVYTVNCLDTFVWYDGDKPWTGDTLSTIDDWSQIDPNTNKSSHYRIYSKGNTETWCALINSETQYGLGIYVPNVDKLLTMRYLSGQKGDTSAKGNPCSYMCPINVITMTSFQAIEYSYIMAAGSTEEIRAVFSEHRDFDANEGFDVKIPSRRD